MRMTMKAAAAVVARVARVLKVETPPAMVALA
jgi:hypothetical protein